MRRKSLKGKVGMLYPELSAEGAVELVVVLPAGLVINHVCQRRQSLLQFFLVFPLMVKLIHGICFQFLLLCPLCEAGMEERFDEEQETNRKDIERT